MNKIEKLTKAQESQLEVYKTKWLDKVFKYELYNRGAFENTLKQMKQLYEFCKLDSPIVLYLDSPLACQIVANMFTKTQVRAQVRDQVRAQVRDQVRAQVRDQVWAQVGDQVWDQVQAQVWAQVGDQVGDQVWAQVRAQVGDQVRDQVWDQVGDQVGAQVGDQVRDQVWAQVWAQVGDQVRDQVWDQVGDQVRDQVWAQVWAQVGDQVGAQVGDQVWAQVWAQVGDQVGAQVGDQVWAQVGDQVGDQVQAQVWDQVGDQVGAQVGDQVGDQEKLAFYTFSSYINYSNFGILAFYEFMDNCLSLNLSDDLKKWIHWSQSAFMSIQLDGLCIVSKFPNFISRNQSNDLHNIDGYAIKFDDGYGLNYINGKFIPEDMFNQIKDNTYKLESFLSEKNEEVKSVAIEMIQLIHGDSFLVRFFGDNLKEIDSFIDKKEEKYLKGTTKGMNIGVYTLYKGKINGDNIAYVQCYCPSTDRMFFLGVEPHHTKAKDAIASLYRVPTVVKNEIKSISRQGERFFTSFTDEGYNRLKQQKNIKDYSTITGEEYFSKIQYEF